MPRPQGNGFTTVPEEVIIATGSGSSAMHAPAEYGDCRPWCGERDLSYRRVETAAVQPLYEPCQNCFDVEAVSAD